MLSLFILILSSALCDGRKSSRTFPERNHADTDRRDRLHRQSALLSRGFRWFLLLCSIAIHYRHHHHHHHRRRRRQHHHLRSSTTIYSDYHLLRRQRGALAMWLIPLLRRLTSCGPAYLPPVAPLPLRRGLSRQVHQPKCHSAYLCVVPTKAEQCGQVVRFFPLFLPLSPFLSPSLSLLSLFLSPRTISSTVFFPPIHPPTCFRLSLFLSLSLYCFSFPLSLVYPLRHHLTQQCCVVSCHPAVRQRSSRTEGKDRSGRRYTLRLPGPVDRRCIVEWRKWSRGDRGGEGSDSSMERAIFWHG